MTIQQTALFFALQALNLSLKISLVSIHYNLLKPNKFATKNNMVSNKNREVF